jgi:putative ABC transport system permease protein
MLVLALFLGTVIGIYPAIITGNVSVIRIIKGTNLPIGKSGFQNILVFIQLVISIGFIVSTFIFNKQLYFIRHKNLGFDKDKILNFNLYANGSMSKEDYNYFMEKSNVLKNTLLKYNSIKYASINSFLPSELNRNHSISFPGQSKDQEMGVFVISGDKDFTTTFNIQIISGEDRIRNFRFNGTFGYILNESAVEALGWQDPLDKQFSIFGPESPGRIIGVCKDFNYRSLHYKIGPCVIIIGEGGSQISLKIEGIKINETIANVGEKYKELFPESPFDYYFFDQDFNKMYKSEIKITGTSGAVTVFSLVIAGLGLFGLASFSTVQRTKEIGIRKVFGSSDFSIIWIFLKEIFWLVIFALIITTPLTIFILNNWLKNYAYKTTISWWIFPCVGLATLILSWLTIIYQAIKAGRKNPVDILRFE